MSPDTKPNPAGKDETPSSACRKATSGKPQEPALKCPRCDSPNTKFCYYNNYSLTQPRHFCKTCRRYWTKGGALRSVPIGGGCRKNKKMKSSPRLSGDSKDSMDFQLGGMSFPRVHCSSSSPALFNQFSNLGDLSNTSCAISSNPCFNFDPSGTNPPPLMGFAFPLSSTIKQGDQMGSLNLHTSLASSIESLSSINQDLHWILQKQRLSMMFDNQKDSNSISSIQPTIVQKPQPILFQNLEISKADQIKTTPRKDGGGGNLSTELFFDNSYGAVNETPATSSSNVNENTSSWSGIQAWSDLSQYSSLP